MANIKRINNQDESYKYKTNIISIVLGGETIE